MEAVAQVEPVPVKETVLNDAFAQEISQQTSSMPDNMPVLALLGFTDADREKKQRIEKMYPEMQESVVEKYVSEWEAREQATPEWTRYLQEQPVEKRTSLALSVRGLDRKGYKSLADIRSKSVGELIHAPGYAFLTKYVATFWKKALGPSPSSTPTT